jgi:hypothetical protein
MKRKADWDGIDDAVFTWMEERKRFTSWDLDSMILPED